MKLLKENQTEIIYKTLKQDIINKKLKGGSKLTLKLLEDKFQIETKPLKEAMDLLINDGLLIQENDDDIQVVALDESDVEELYYMVMILDQAALSKAQDINFESLILEMAMSLERQEEALNEGSQEKFFPASEYFHNLMYVMADNQRLYESYNKHRHQVSLLNGIYLNTVEDHQRTFEDHKAIFQALCQGNINLALGHLKNHLSTSEDIILHLMKEGN